MCISHGPDKAFEICRIALEQPMMTIRANTLKTTRDQLIKTFRDRQYNFDVTECEFAPNGIRFKKKPEDSMFKLNEYKRGHFEM